MIWRIARQKCRIQNGFPLNARGNDTVVRHAGMTEQRGMRE